MAPAGEGEDPLAELRGRVLWIGGAPDAGKTTLAGTRAAARFAPLRAGSHGERPLRARDSRAPS